MFKNLTTSQVVLIALGAALFLLAAFSFYLLQDPTAPLPFVPPPPSATVTPLPASPTSTPEPSFTSLPTRRTSYTPFAATSTVSTGTPPQVTTTPGTATLPPTATLAPATPTTTATFLPGFTPSTSTATSSTRTVTPTSSTGTVTPTTSPTLSPGQVGVSGRIVQNGNPVANVVVQFFDDDPPRRENTNSSGVYWFTTLAPGTTFYLEFQQAENPGLTPPQNIASIAWMQGTLPIGVEIINLPDLEISKNLEGMSFELQSPADGATQSAAAISQLNPIQFNWTLYNQGEAYYVEMGPYGSEDVIWTSDETTSTNLMWDGILGSGNHITEGAYWWRVGVSKNLGSYNVHVFTQVWDIVFTQ